MKKILKSFLLMPLLLVACNNNQSSSLVSDGYSLNGEYGFFEKIEGDTYNINIAKMGYPVVEKLFSLPKEFNHLNIIGDSTKTVLDFSISLEDRTNALSINLSNVSVKSRTDHPFLELNNLSKTVNLVIDGECNIKGYSGLGGVNGASYDVDKGLENPINGSSGSNGQSGSSAIHANDLSIIINESSSLNVSGGNGGYAGNGGHGSGGDASSTGNCGNGGNGGLGGNGASAIIIDSSLSIANNGTVQIFGGNGGNGGSAGNGGNNAPANPLNVPDNGGNGGKGGNGGNGGYAIQINDMGSLNITKSKIYLYGGNGGDAGNGGNGGSTNYLFNVTPKPGDGGDGGNGGNGMNSISCSFNDLLAETTPGIGGKYGFGGANSSYYFIGTSTHEEGTIESKNGQNGHNGSSGSH